MFLLLLLSCYNCKTIDEKMLWAQNSPLLQHRTKSNTPFSFSLSCRKCVKERPPSCLQSQTPARLNQQERLLSSDAPRESVVSIIRFNSVKDFSSTLHTNAHDQSGTREIHTTIRWSNCKMRNLGFCYRSV